MQEFNKTSSRSNIFQSKYSFLLQRKVFHKYSFVLFHKYSFLLPKSLKKSDFSKSKRKYLSQKSLNKKKKSQQQLFLLLVLKVPYAGGEAMSGLKLQEYGVPKEHMAYIATLMTPISVVTPLFITKWTTGPNPLSLILTLYLPRILLVLVTIPLIMTMPAALSDKSMDPFPWTYYGVLLVLSGVACVVGTSVFAAQMAYFAKVSPKDIGGTYMTFLNTASNLGILLFRETNMFAF